MASKCEQIMAYLDTRLATDLTGVAAVARGRKTPVAKREGVVLKLYWSVDTVAEETVQEIDVRELRVHTDIIARGDLPDQAADAARVAAHASIMTDITLGGRAVSIRERLLQNDQESADDDAGVLRRSYAVFYQAEIDKDD